MESNLPETGVGEGDVELAEARQESAKRSRPPRMDPLRDFEKVNGDDFVERAAGKTGDQIVKECQVFRHDRLASTIRFLEWKYQGALQGFAGSLHSICILEAASRFTRKHSQQA